MAKFFEIKPFKQLKDALNYAGDKVYFKSDNVEGFSRIYKDCLFNIVLIEDFDEYLKEKDNIKSLESTENKVSVYCLKEKSERTILYSKENSFVNKNEYQIYFVYNKEQIHFEQYYILDKVKKLEAYFLKLMFFDLSAVDTEVV